MCMCMRPFRNIWIYEYVYCVYVYVFVYVCIWTCFLMRTKKWKIERDENF